MTNRLQDGAAWLAGKIKDFAGVACVYYRGADSVSVTGTINDKLYETVDDQGFTTQTKITDFTFTAADLVISGSTIKPQRGDKIEIAEDGSTVGYEVLPSSAAEREWERFDNFGTMILVHTKRIG